MRSFFLLIALLPLPALAGVQLADCDGKSYDVTIRNGGAVRRAQLTSASGPIEEYGPMISFEIPGQTVVTATRPDEEFCVWDGHIDVQRLDTNAQFGGSGFR